MDSLDSLDLLDLLRWSLATCHADRHADLEWDSSLFLFSFSFFFSFPSLSLYYVLKSQHVHTYKTPTFGSLVTASVAVVNLVIFPDRSSVTFLPYIRIVDHHDLSLPGSLYRSLMYLKLGTWCPSGILALSH
jgi:hypothetical protein